MRRRRAPTPSNVETQPTFVQYFFDLLYFHGSGVILDPADWARRPRPGVTIATLPGSQRFFESTRGRVVDHLRRGPATVDEIAAALDLTDNAVRAHLITLERDGFARAYGVRRDGSVGKPAALFGLVPEAEAALSRAYAPLVRAMVGAIRRRLSPGGMRAVFREAGRRLATGRPPAEGSLRERAAFGAAVLNELGGMATVEGPGEASGFRIRGRGCPLSEAVREDPGVCTAVTTMLADLTGADVRQRCEHGEHPQCRFELAAKRG
ncbi:MAG: helix-turn-helix transcriptional regulator [Gemmatimonadaceae bacterium]